VLSEAAAKAPHSIVSLVMNIRSVRTRTVLQTPLPLEYLIDKIFRTGEYEYADSPATQTVSPAPPHAAVATIIPPKCHTLDFINV